MNYINEMKDVFDFKNYQEYLKWVLPVKGEERGVRSKLALFLDCRVSHITQVIQGQSHMGLEMAQKTAEFLRLSHEESHFFLLLVSMERAGTEALKKYFQKQIDEVLSARSNIKQRLRITDELTSEQVMHYYSSWHYSAVHLLCSLPEIKTANDIQNRLRLPLEKIKESISFLSDSNIVVQTSEGLNTTGRRIHLEAKSKMISKHHTNWRVKTIEELGLAKPESLHFSAVYSFARKDWDAIKESFLKSIKSSELIIEKSPEDMIGAVCVDFYEI